MAVKPEAYKEPEYQSQYQGEVDSALGKVTNREAFSYDPLKDANYKALEKVYTKRGELAAKNTMADAATLNGGYGTSYATSAAAQARNDFNQELAAQIPALADAAYNRYVNNYNMDVTALNALMDAENANYAKFRDIIGDSQWKYGMDMSQYQYENDFEYQKERDKVADAHWLKEFNLAKKGRGSGGGGSRGTGGGGGSYGGSSGSDSFIDEVKKAAAGKGKNKSIVKKVKTKITKATNSQGARGPKGKPLKMR